MRFVVFSNASCAGDIDLSYPVQQAIVATLDLNDVTKLAKRAVSELECEGHASHEAALAQLLALSVSDLATRAVFDSPGCAITLRQALGTPPTSQQGFSAWLLLLEVLHRALRAHALDAAALYGALTAFVPAAIALLARWSPGSASGPAMSDALELVRELHSFVS